MATRMKTIEPVNKPLEAFSRTPVSMRPEPEVLRGGFGFANVQQTAGNLAIQRTFQAGLVQAKLAVGLPNDPYEQEADRVAVHVMSSAPAIQRKCDACAAGSACPKCDDEQKIRMKGLQGHTPQMTSQFASSLSSPHGGSQPLSTSLRNFFEPRFGADFSQVRVHTNHAAVQMTRDLRAQAFTHKQDIYYGEGKTPRQDELTAHELTHVIQQTGKPQTKPSTVQLKCSACPSEPAGAQRHPNISAAYQPEIQRLPLLGNDENATGSAQSSDGGILDWVEKKASGAVTSITSAVTSITDAGGAVVDWAKQQAGAAIQAGEEAMSPAVLEKAKRLASLLKCKLSLGKDGLILSCPRIKLTDPLEEKVWTFPSLSKVKDLKDYVIPGVKLEAPKLGYDIGPSLWLTVGSVTLDNVVIRIDPFKDTYFGEGQVNLPVGSHLVLEIAGKISGGVTVSIPIAEGVSLPIKAFAEGGFRGEGVGSSLMNFLHRVRLSYVGDQFIFDFTHVMKAGLKVQINVVAFLNVQYQVAERAKKLCEFTAPLWGPWEKWIKAEEMSIPISIRPGQGDSPVTIGPIARQPIGGEEIEGGLSRNLPGLQGKCEELCDLIEEGGDPAQLMGAAGAVFGPEALTTLSSAVDEVCGARRKKPPFPSGLTNRKGDRILMSWFKDVAHYQRTITLDSGIYDMRGEKELPGSGENLGVRFKYFPFAGKPLKKVTFAGPDPKRTQFRKDLEDDGYDWDNPARQADHVQDKTWATPNQNEERDAYDNLWPLHEDINECAGRDQNQNQMVTFCETPGCETPLKRPIGDSRLLDRFFEIEKVEPGCS